MAMEAHKLRFVRCPKCNQLLVEYPSIHVYKCGGCGAVLRAKYRAFPVTQAGSESEEHSSVPSSLNGSPQNNKSICSDEQKTASSDKACEDVVDGSVSYTTNNTNSGESAAQEITMSVVESVTRGEHLNKETCSLIDANVQNSGLWSKRYMSKILELVLVPF